MSNVRVYVKVLANIFLVIIVLCAFVSTCWLGLRTGNYWPALFISFVVVLYYSLTWPFKTGSLRLSIQQLIINTFVGLAIIGGGIFSIFLGFSEFSAPVHFSLALSNLIANLIRNTIGSFGVSLLMWCVGCMFIFVGVGRLRLSKLSSSNPSFKRDA